MKASYIQDQYVSFVLRRRDGGRSDEDNLGVILDLTNVAICSMEYWTLPDV